MFERLFGIGDADEEQDEEEDPPDPTPAVPEDDGPDLDGFERRLDEIEDDLDRNRSTVEAVQGTQDDIAERLDDLDDQIRQLLGVYDQLTEDVNPLTADGDGTGGAQAAAAESGTGESESADGFGVVDAEGAVSFDDLQDDTADGPAGGGGDAHGGHETESTHEPRSSSDAAADEGGRAAARRADRLVETDEAVLERVPRTYAADIVVFEWLSMLIENGGPAATFQALDYYEEVGWIAPEVREYLEDVLAGPGLDVDLDPSAPSTLSTDDHARSNEYLARLAAIVRGLEEG